SATLTASFTNPAEGATVDGTVSVGMSASGAGGGSATFTLTVDGQPAFSNTTTGTTQTYPWDTRSVADGVHTLGLTVRDATGATVSGAAVWTTMWVEGAAAGSKTYTLSVGGRNLASTSDTSNGPVTLAWDSRQVTNGIQTLRAMVTDSAGALGSTTVQVNVQN